MAAGKSESAEEDEDGSHSPDISSCGIDPRHLRRSRLTQREIAEAAARAASRDGEVEPQQPAALTKRALQLDPSGSSLRSAQPTDRRRKSGIPSEKRTTTAAEHSVALG